MEEGGVGVCGVLAKYLSWLYKNHLFKGFEGHILVTKIPRKTSKQW